MTIALLGCGLLLLPSMNEARAKPQGVWGSAVAITSTDVNSTSPDVAISPQGKTTLAWFSENRAFVAQRRRGGPFLPPVRYNVDPRRTEDVKMQIAPSGAGVIGWISPGGSVSAIARDSSGVWQYTYVASMPLMGSQASENLAVDANDRGNAGVAWLEKTNSGTLLKVSSSDEVGQGFGAVQDIDFADEDQTPGIAIGPEGASVLVWATDPPASRVRVATRRAVGPFPTFGYFIDQETLGSGRDPIVESGEDGSTAVAWTKPGNPGKAMVSVRLENGRFTNPFSIASTRGDVSPLGIAFDPKGNTLLFSRLKLDSNKSVLILSAEKTPGKFRKPVLLSSAEDNVRDLDVSTSENGTVNVVWNSEQNGDFDRRTLLSSTRLPGGDFSQPVAITRESTKDPAVASGPEGYAAAAWLNGVTGKYDNSFVEMADANPDASYCGRTEIRAGQITSTRHRKVLRLEIKNKGIGKIFVRGNRWLRPTREYRRRSENDTVYLLLKKEAIKELIRNHKLRIKVRVDFKPGFGCSTRHAVKTTIIRLTGPSPF